MHFQPTVKIHQVAGKLISAILLVFIVSGISTLRAQKIKVACVGNSVTYGYGLQDPASQSYPAILQGLLGDQYEVANLGHSGATLLKKGHNPYYKTPEFLKAIQMHPDMVIIHLGLNDTDPRDYALYRDAFISDYNWLIDTFRQVNPAVKIFICKMTPIFTGHPRYLSSTQIWYDLVQKDIEQVARLSELPLIDLFANFHDRPDLITDAPTLHPNQKGAAKLAKVIYQHLSGNFGGLKLPDIFTDNMVLQRDNPIRIWGTADAGTTVQITFNGFTRQCKVPFDGHWQLQFAPQKANSQPQSLVIINGTRTIRLQNILIGDLWLCSGQSNMLFTTKEAQAGDSLIENSANAPGILRLFNYHNLAATDNVSWDRTTLSKTNQLQFFSGSWQLPGKASVASFSAIGYVFGSVIASKENIPIGLIELAVGGSPLISWVDRRTLEKDPLFEPALHDWQHSDYLMEWCRQRAQKNIEISSAPYQRHPYEPAYNYEAGIAKFAGLPIKGVLWYQGESDADNAPLYGRLFPLLIKSWRQAWQKELPFYYVQLSSLDRPSWNYFRDMQRKLLARIPDTKMVVTSDLGDSLNVHYRNKIPVGQRLARVALKQSYHHNIEDSGPQFGRLTSSQGKLVLHFTHAAGLTTKQGQPLKGFQLIDQKGRLFKAHARITGPAVEITLPSGGPPITAAVYGWQPYSTANLMNAAGLPAGTFKVNLIHP